MLPLRPDMASLSVGSNNFPNRVYENPPDLVDWLASEMLKHDVKPEIEAFDLSHIVQATRMATDGRLKGPLYVQFVMGVKNAMPADKPIFDFYIETLKRLAPDAEWCAAGIGPNQLLINEWSIAAGGHTRTGLEDNVRLDRGSGQARGRDLRAPRASRGDLATGARDSRPAPARLISGGAGSRRSASRPPARRRRHRG